MARDLDAGTLAAIEAAVKRPVLFFLGTFATGTLRLWSGVGEFVWDGQVWTGAGQMLGISQIEEADDLVAVSCTVSLAGESQALLSANIGAARQGLPGRVWVGFLDEAGDLVGEPFEAFSGRFDVPDILDDGIECRLSARYESRLIGLTRPRIRRWTHQDQQLRSPGDKGFEFVTALQDASINWGRPGASRLALNATPAGGSA